MCTQVCAAAPSSFFTPFLHSTLVTSSLFYYSLGRLAHPGSAVSLAWNNGVQLSTLDRAHPTLRRQKTRPAPPLGDTLSPQTSGASSLSLLPLPPSCLQTLCIYLLLCLWLTSSHRTSDCIRSFQVEDAALQPSCTGLVWPRPWVPSQDFHPPLKFFLYSHLRSWPCKH